MHMHAMHMHAMVCARYDVSVAMRTHKMLNCGKNIKENRCDRREAKRLTGATAGRGVPG